jgi:hypothetical protein
VPLPVVSVASVRATAYNAEFDAIADATIQTIIDEVAPLYSGDLLSTGEGVRGLRDKAANLHVAHLLFIDVVNGDQPGGGAPISSVSLRGVGTISYAIAAQQQPALGDALSVPSPYLRRLMQQRDAMPPGCVGV